MNIRGIVTKSWWTKVTSRFRRQRLEKVKSTEQGKLGYLESIRGLAALVVLFAHIMAAYFPAAGGGPSLPSLNKPLEDLLYGLPFGFLINGHFAVVMFFTLSGFVLCYKYFQSHDIYDLQKQLAKRYFRLAIPIFVIVLVSYFMLANGAMSFTNDLALLTNSPEAARIFQFIPDLGSALYDATLGVLVYGNDAYNPVLWTMKVELLGSLMVFGFAALTGKLRKRWGLYIAAVILFNQSYLTCFVLGMALADLAINTNFIDYARKKVAPIYWYMALLLVWVPASLLNTNSDLIQNTFHSLFLPGLDVSFTYNILHFSAAFILLMTILVRAELQRALSLKIFVFIGSISFAIYLTHYLLLHSLGAYVYVYTRTFSGANSSALCATIVVVVTTFIISYLWKKYIDDLSVAVSRRFAQYFLK